MKIINYKKPAKVVISEVETVLLDVKHHGLHIWAKAW
jgi:hypothetical protein